MVKLGSRRSVDQEWGKGKRGREKEHGKGEGGKGKGQKAMRRLTRFFILSPDPSLFPLPSGLDGVRGKQSYDKTVGVAPA
ncbi:MAG TPA: hypothetical protein VER76_11520 [Pyrinomonadaceae bacterium]|nr:hypothetical protein [Pyrinomonadaceae bacterium]